MNKYVKVQKYITYSFKTNKQKKFIMCIFIHIPTARRNFTITNNNNKKNTHIKMRYKIFTPVSMLKEILKERLEIIDAQ